MAPSTVTVFGTANFANAARVMACLEEVGVEYEVVEVDYMAKEHKGADHLARNPFGQIPAFQDGDVKLFESRAIAKYVLRKYSKSAEVDLLREGNPEEAAVVDVWTEVEAHTYFPAIAPIFYECVVFPALHGTPPNQEVVEKSVEKLKEVLDVTRRTYRGPSICISPGISSASRTSTTSRLRSTSWRRRTRRSSTRTLM